MIDYEVRGRTAFITINRPEARNAIGGAAAKGLKAAVARLEADAEVWTGVLTGAGSVSSAGADPQAPGPRSRRRDVHQAGELRWLPRTKPMSAAVDGAAPGPVV